MQIDEVESVFTTEDYPILKFEYCVIVKEDCVALEDIYISNDAMSRDTLPEMCLGKCDEGWLYGM